MKFGREICGTLAQAEAREWLVTNGIGGYASGTVAGLLTRCYHGLLVGALKPPLGRTLLLTKLDETALYNNYSYGLCTNRWTSGVVDPQGYLHIESFQLEGTTPVWHMVFADALLQKRVWMQPGANTTYVQYHLHRATAPLTLTLKALVNYRDYHSRTQGGGWKTKIDTVEHGVCVVAFPNAVPLYLLSDRGRVSFANDWCYGFDLAQERYRGLSVSDDNLHAATFEATLQPGESLTFVASTDNHPDLRRTREQNLPDIWNTLPVDTQPEPEWIKHLILAADQFIVTRPLPNEPDGKTIIAGYHWFSDWGRDTAISLPGLTISTGRLDIARKIIETFARYVDQGMIPNRFPDSGETPEYNTVDATLWYFEAIRAYYEATGDEDFLHQLFPVLADIVDWHCRGTRYNIHRDANDGLLYAGQEGVQLTWMDAKVGNWVVTPRIGKPVEVNALWYNALHTIMAIAQKIGKPYAEYEQMRDLAAAGFKRFWNNTLNYCYDVLDGPQGNDHALRPNQIFAVSLPQSPLTKLQQRYVVESCGRELLTSHGLRSLTPNHPQYQGHYGGDQTQRDGAYHQGTVWGWLIGPYALAHLRVFNNPAQARALLEPMANQLNTHGVGSLSEIFDGDAPMTPRGCIAQAWTVAQVLYAWRKIGE